TTGSVLSPQQDHNNSGVASGAIAPIIKQAHTVFLNYTNHKSIRDAIHRAVEEGAQVVNMAYGTPAEFEWTLDIQAIADEIAYQYANNKNILFVAAAGST